MESPDSVVQLAKAASDYIAARQAYLHVVHNRRSPRAGDSAAAMERVRDTFSRLLEIDAAFRRGRRQ